MVLWCYDQREPRETSVRSGRGGRGIRRKAAGEFCQESDYTERLVSAFNAHEVRGKRHLVIGAFHGDYRCEVTLA